MINKERIDILIDQINDLYTIIDGLRECEQSVPSFLIRMCESKIEKISCNLHLLVNHTIDSHAEVDTTLDKPTKGVIEDCPNSEEITTEEIRAVPSQTNVFSVNEVEYVEEEIDEPDDFDRFVQNLVQPNSEQEPIVQDNRPSERSVIGEKFESQVLHEKIASTTNERVVEQIMGKQLKIDLNKAISLNDKFRFQRELFKGDGAKMAETLSKLNLLANQEETLKFIRKNFDWDNENETVKYFFSILEQRFNA